MRGDWIILVGLCLFVIIIRVFHFIRRCIIFMRLITGTTNGSRKIFLTRNNDNYKTNNFKVFSKVILELIPEALIFFNQSIRILQNRKHRRQERQSDLSTLAWHMAAAHIRLVSARTRYKVLRGNGCEKGPSIPFRFPSTFNGPSRFVNQSVAFFTHHL